MLGLQGKCCQDNSGSVITGQRNTTSQVSGCRLPSGTASSPRHFVSYEKKVVTKKKYLINLFNPTQIHKLLVEWLNDIDQKIQSDDSLLNDLSEKKAKLEKFRTFNRDIDSHKDLVNKLNEKLRDDASLKSKDIDETLKRYGDIRKTVSDMIGVSIIFVSVYLKC